MSVTQRTLPRPAVAATVGSAVTLVLLSALVGAGATRVADRAITVALQSVGSYPLDLVASLHTFVALWPVSAALALALAVVLWRRHGRAGAAAPLVIALLVAIELGLKVALDHPGPGDEFDRALWRSPAPQVATPSSFPSGHVARIAFFAVFLAAWLRAGRIGWAAAAVIVALSLVLRVYIGDHWPSDVIGGAALGLGVGALAAAWLERARAYPPAP